MLAVDLLWIVFGIGYIVYKLQKEEKVFTRESVSILLAIAAFLFTPQILVSLIRDEDSRQFIRPIVTLVVTILPMLGLCIYGLFSSVLSEYSSKKESLEINARARQSVQELRKIFEEHGYNNIPIQILEELLENPTSPLKTYGIAGINLQICYSWMCDKGTWEIDKLSRDDIGMKLGVPLDIIPLDKSMELGEASLECTTLAKNRLLVQQGLLYRNFTQYLNKSDEYYKLFNRFVDKSFEKREKVRTLMDDAGYHLSIDLINKVAFDPLSPINSVYVNTPAEELYDWLCEKRTAELSGMTWFDETKFDELLGCPLVEIPPPKGSTELRAICAVQYCLLKEGLTISLKSLIATLYLCKDKENYIEYQDDFNNFVDKYKCKSNIT